MTKQRIAMLISGRGSNMRAILREVQEGCLRDCCEVVLVFANRQDAPGLALAEKQGIPTAWLSSRGVLRETFDREVLALLEPYQPNYIVLAGYMRLLSPVFIQRYRHRIINIHPADTALYQGAHAYQWAFETRRESTTITIHLVDEGVDTGRVLGQREVDLRGAASLAEVEQRGLRVEHELYSQVLEQVFTGKLDVRKT